MEVTKNNIEEYIRRFMEGETTNAEEQAIYRFFRTEEVPEHLKPYTEMFTWYEEGMPEEKLSKPKTQPLWKRIPLEIWSTGIAAMLVVGIGLGIVLSFGDNQHEDWSCYEGSYVEVDGKRITDIETILPIILETLKGAEEIEQRTEARLTRIRSIEEYTREKENINTNF